ncbi:S-adenosyl-L-methionine-dependent methyltransferase [Thamnocephalis sphaerospora]|uniref:S-adenosyl-L-methionine-dependent methyltransferase n=1 Tax=Thamnocephalis sphaerospora TaxID=78915 RepID=A0A4V1IXH3_9FUNG|nr:S-adenosyl-L-methionine-dependent methyltransferase [Thamnocephalis sphaerospora]|eukprot:RKP11059.1 S-adenosyl-L-methionine-dependent methyltransferase [Thamnocephalis sphaerospora]
MTRFTKNMGNDSKGKGKSSRSFTYVDGRRHHNNPSCPYPLPNDLEEINRLDIQHHVIQQVTQRRYFAPLDNPKRAIDIGTGTGIWMMETATDYPECEFLGIDIAPLQPTVVLPQNCRFELRNALEPFPHSTGYFDYVRHRLLVAAIPKDKWVPYVRECVRICASGGWVEMIDTNCAYQGGGAAWRRIGSMVKGALRARGLSLETVDILDTLMREAGLVDVCVEEFKVPAGRLSGGGIGELFLSGVCMATMALMPLFATTYGMSHQELDELVRKAKKEVEQHAAYLTFRAHIGRKP